MSNFKLILEEEIKRQEQLIENGRSVLAHAPEGALRTRGRKHGRAIYIYKGADGIMGERNITDDEELIRLLVKKRINKDIIKLAVDNLKRLEELQKHYISNDLQTIVAKLPDSYKQAIAHLGKTVIRSGKEIQAEQYNFDPSVHIHDTVCGIKTRSKGEALICNMLASYKIPFYYEKPFPFAGPGGKVYYPDFTIPLPNGEYIIWEHFGLLNNLNYCMHNAEKINLYQEHNYLIGQNFIITQDDSHGGINTAYIDMMIRRDILPFFQ